MRSTFEFLFLFFFASLRFVVCVFFFLLFLFFLFDLILLFLFLCFSPCDNICLMLPPMRTVLFHTTHCCSHDTCNKQTNLSLSHSVRRSLLVCCCCCCFLLIRLLHFTVYNCIWNMIIDFSKNDFSRRLDSANVFTLRYSQLNRTNVFARTHTCTYAIIRCYTTKRLEQGFQMP